MLDLARIDAEIKAAGISIDGVSLSPSGESPNGRVDFVGATSQADKDAAYSIFDSHFTPAGLLDHDKRSAVQKCQSKMNSFVEARYPINHLVQIVGLIDDARGRGWNNRKNKIQSLMDWLTESSQAALDAEDRINSATTPEDVDAGAEIDYAVLAVSDPGVTLRDLLGTLD